ncbi:MAG: Crp/Fnr family transcriptional regulator [Oscillospiraceae bacterium]|nr:Crp/Fnr family transcriptional regulator [Oscillospiraceae bacterium]
MRHNLEPQMPRLGKTPLFTGITKDEIRVITCLLGGDILRYPAGAGIPCGAGINLVMTGLITLERDDLWGGTGIVERLGPNELLPNPGEYKVVACLPSMLFHMKVPSGSLTSKWGQLEKNLTQMYHEREQRLWEKSDILSHRSVRGRILTYLSYESKRRGTLTLQLQMDRKTLAEYLCVVRTRLSAELVQLQKDGLIQYKGNYVTLLPNAIYERSVV